MAGLSIVSRLCPHVALIHVHTSSSVSCSNGVKLVIFSGGEKMQTPRDSPRFPLMRYSTLVTSPVLESLTSLSTEKEIIGFDYKVLSL